MEKILLKDYFNDVDTEAYLEYYPANTNEKTEGILIFPGGGYWFCSNREGGKVAKVFNEKGFNCFVLYYKTLHFEFPFPLNEAMMAIAYIRKNADKYNIHSDHIGVMGFSAGGHLAASLAVHYNDENILNPLGLTQVDTKPNGLILAYPVLSTKEDGHDGTTHNITQDREDLKEYFHIFNHISSDFPPTFVWNTRDDQMVSATNSIRLMETLYFNNVICEYHCFPEGVHGLSICSLDNWKGEYMQPLNEQIIKDHEYCHDWIDEATKFIKRYI